MRELFSKSWHYARQCRLIINSTYVVGDLGFDGLVEGKCDEKKEISKRIQENKLAVEILTAFSGQSDASKASQRFAAFVRFN